MTGSINKFEDFVTNDDYTYPMFIPTVAGIVLLFFMLSFLFESRNACRKDGPHSAGRSSSSYVRAFA